MRRARRPPAAHPCSRHAQQPVEQRGPALPLQGRCHAGKEAAAQVAAEQSQRQRRQRRAQRDAASAAGGTQQQRLHQHHPQALARGQAEHAQQRELLCAPRHTQREHGKHQESPGEQGHQCQHREIHAVGARQVAHPLGRVAGLAGRDPRRQPQRCDEGRAVGAGLQAQVDAAEAACRAEQVLRGADVHHGQRRAARVHAAAHAHRAQRQRALQLQRRGAVARQSAGRQRRHRGRVQEHGGWGQHREPVGPGGGLGHQGRRHGPNRERIDSHHAHRHAPAVLPRGDGVGGQLQHRAGQHHLRMRGRSGEQRLVQVSLHAAQFQVGLAIDRAHRAGELAQRRGIDQVHRERQRYPQHHRHDRRRIAPGVVAQFLPGEGAQESEHAVDCAGALGMACSRRLI
ncbi:MAG: hypothetical protein BWX79_00910 [Alphaproteobacteria bacterium ADurb.Bin100]|nr:MAG: hypothetical protein BWX79_00910 [Alphaproteobacteria bacterium ADurb.Bin100]